MGLRLVGQLVGQLVFSNGFLVKENISHAPSQNVSTIYYQAVSFAWKENQIGLMARPNCGFNVNSAINSNQLNKNFIEVRRKEAQGVCSVPTLALT